VPASKRARSGRRVVRGVSAGPSGMDGSITHSQLHRVQPVGEFYMLFRPKGRVAKLLFCLTGIDFARPVTNFDDLA
jgi:hypothetical protein